MMDQRQKILPFYMTYPLPLFYEEEDTVMKDLEYMQELYPREAKKFHKKVAQLLERFDHQGSVIYDDYPDRLAIYKMAQDMMAVIEKQERDAGCQIGPELKPVMAELVQLLLCMEIYKRRQAKGSCFLKF